METKVIEKLELKPTNLIKYLPYSLKVIMESKKTSVAWMSTKNISVIRPDGVGEYKKIPWKHAHLNIKPILRPLSDITKEVDNGKKYTPAVILWRISQGLIDPFNPSDYCYNGKFNISHFVDEFGLDVIQVEPIEDDKEPILEILWDKDGIPNFYRSLDGNNNRECIYSVYNQYELYEWLWNHHFDTDNLIEKNLAIDVNTLKENPYK